MLSFSWPILVRDTIYIVAAIAINLSLVGNCSASMIDTSVDWDGIEFVGEFGDQQIENFGQTFVAPTDMATLDSFSFWLDDRESLSIDPVDFSGHVMQWDAINNRATGPLLYSSGRRVTTNNGGLGGFEKFTFLTGGIALVPGEEYVAFVSTINYLDTQNDRSWVGFTREGSYTEGAIAYLNSPDSADWTTATWERNVTSEGADDLAFQASFSSGDGAASAVPEPASMVTLLIALCTVWLGSSCMKHR